MGLTKRTDDYQSYQYGSSNKAVRKFGLSQLAVKRELNSSIGGQGMTHTDEEIYIDLKLEEVNTDDFCLLQEVTLTDDDMQLMC